MDVISATFFTLMQLEMECLRSFTDYTACSKEEMDDVETSWVSHILSMGSADDQDLVGNSKNTMTCILVLSLQLAAAYLVVHCAVTSNDTKFFNCGDIIVIACKAASCTGPISLRRNRESSLDCVPNQPCLESATRYNRSCQLDEWKFSKVADILDDGVRHICTDLKTEDTVILTSVINNQSCSSTEKDQKVTENKSVWLFIPIGYFVGVLLALSVTWWCLTCKQNCLHSLPLWILWILLFLVLLSPLHLLIIIWLLFRGASIATDTLRQFMKLSANKDKLNSDQRKDVVYILLHMFWTFGVVLFVTRFADKDGCLSTPVQLFTGRSPVQGHCQDYTGVKTDNQLDTEINA
ncbi:uncharacterized protein LOC127859395 isoform X2 [Dreissena polymorpha]|uniref:uncharacterized protein LOC127859395 isoform X2 n=1 Tax=Dreissena polymorpha TaxID=45954 RepID=UPI002263EBDB|nr:uncharacterized protein LOC127859395 isoform X2 [Dreissena polymorpha]